MRARLFAAAVIFALGSLAGPCPAQSIRGFYGFPAYESNFGQVANHGNAVTISLSDGYPGDPSGGSKFWRSVGGQPFAELGDWEKEIFTLALSRDGSTAALSNVRGKAIRESLGGARVELPGFVALPTDLSGNGNVTVGQSSSTGHQDDPPEATRWVGAEALSALGFLESGNTSWAAACSIDGSVVVGSSNLAPYGSATRAFRWTESGGLTALPLPPDATLSSGVDVSGDGATALLNAAASESYLAPRSVWLWTSGSGLELVSSDLSALQMSDDGNVILGRQSIPPFGYILWTRSGGARTLSEAAAASGVDLTGWSLNFAFGLSADGTLIVGRGTHKGVDAAFLLSLTRDLPATPLRLRWATRPPRQTSRTSLGIRLDVSNASLIEVFNGSRPAGTVFGSSTRFTVRPGRNVIRVVASNPVETRILRATVTGRSKKRK